MFHLHMMNYIQITCIHRHEFNTNIMGVSISYIYNL